MVYKSWSYWLITVLSLVVITFFLFWLHNKDLLGFITNSNLFSFFEKLKLYVNAFVNLGANFTSWTLVVTIFISVFTAMNVTFIVYFIKRRIALQRISGLGVFSIIFGLFGVGCSACGSVLLSSVLGITTATALMGYLPFNGKEIGIIAIIILAISNYIILYKIKNPPVCKIKKK